MLKTHVERAPLKRNVDAAEVGATAAFLLSEAGSGITGETIFVDCGYKHHGVLRMTGALACARFAIASK